MNADKCQHLGPATDMCLCNTNIVRNCCYKFSFMCFSSGELKGISDFVNTSNAPMKNFTMSTVTRAANNHNSSNIDDRMSVVNRVTNYSLVGSHLR